MIQDDRYRYTLVRELGLEFKAYPINVLFVMLNPSTADAVRDDPTIRKCRGFAHQKFSASSFSVVNLFAWRATKPADLRKASESEDIVGPENDEYIRLAASVAHRTVFAWGSLSLGSMSDAAKARSEHVARIVLGQCQAPVCIGRTAAGHPRHPLMTSYETPVSIWTPEWAASKLAKST